MADHIPGGDAEFNAWLDNFVTYAGVNLANPGLVQGDIDPIVTAQGAWDCHARTVGAGMFHRAIP